MTDAAFERAVDAYQRYFAELTPGSVGDLRRLVVDDMQFRDPFNDVRGVDKVIRILAMSFEDTEGLRFEFTDRAVSGRTCYYRWRCHFRPRRLKSAGDWTLEGMSEVAFDDTGLRRDGVRLRLVWPLLPRVGLLPCAPCRHRHGVARRGGP